MAKEYLTSNMILTRLLQKAIDGSQQSSFTNATRPNNGGNTLFREFKADIMEHWTPPTGNTEIPDLQKILQFRLSFYFPASSWDLERHGAMSRLMNKTIIIRTRAVAHAPAKAPSPITSWARLKI